MSYAQALESLSALTYELAAAPGVPRRKFDLDQMRTLARALGSPEQAFPSVLIAGTNGKGSTAAMLASVATAAGSRTGLYTSPHLSQVNERIQIDGIPIAEDDFARLYFRVDEAAARLVQAGELPQHPSFFETLTALAFLYFAEQQVALAVLEVGMGGRLDATNIVAPLLSVITDISLDHTEWLGPTIDAIAREKAGILRPRGTLVTLPQHPQANQAIGEIATALEVHAVNAAAFLPSVLPAPGSLFEPSVYPVSLAGQPQEIRLPLAGSHQHRNAALAIAAALELCNRHGYNLTPSTIARGIAATRWPGRLEFFPPTASRCALLLDVAHNPAGAWTLRAALAGQGGTLLFGCLRDKAVEEIAQILFPVFDRVVVTPLPSPRSATTGQLARAAESLGISVHAADSPLDGFQQALRLTPADRLLTIAGSVYLVGELRPEILREQSCPA